MQKGKLYLLPNTLGECDINYVLPIQVQNIITELRFFIVENIRTTRRYLRKLDTSFPIDNCTFYELNQHTKPADINSYLIPVFNGNNAGIMSEAGVPGVADPGADVVALAHKNNITVVPLVGPSSILLSIMAAGLNGQSFAFNGYLPVKPDDRSRAIKLFERRSQTEHQSQMFIETPYRNQNLFNDFLKTLAPNTLLSIAADVSLNTEQIKTLTANDWKKQTIELNKRPAIFIIQG